MGDLEEVALAGRAVRGSDLDLNGVVARRAVFIDPRDRHGCAGIGRHRVHLRCFAQRDHRFVAGHGLRERRRDAAVVQCEGGEVRAAARDVQNVRDVHAAAFRAAVEDARLRGPGEQREVQAEIAGAGIPVPGLSARHHGVLHTEFDFKDVGERAVRFGIDGAPVGEGILVQRGNGIQAVPAAALKPRHDRFDAGGGSSRVGLFIQLEMRGRAFVRRVAEAQEGIEQVGVARVLRGLVDLHRKVKGTALLRRVQIHVVRQAGRDLRARHVLRPEPVAGGQVEERIVVAVFHIGKDPVRDGGGVDLQHRDGFLPGVLDRDRGIAVRRSEYAEEGGDQEENAQKDAECFPEVAFHRFILLSQLWLIVAFCQLPVCR